MDLSNFLSSSSKLRSMSSTHNSVSSSELMTNTVKDNLAVKDNIRKIDQIFSSAPSDWLAAEVDARTSVFVNGFVISFDGGTALLSMAEVDPST